MLLFLGFAGVIVASLVFMDWSTFSMVFPTVVIALVVYILVNFISSIVWSVRTISNIQSKNSGASEDTDTSQDS